MLLLPLQADMIVYVDGSYPIYPAALDTLFSIYVTLTSLGYLAVVPQVQDYTQFFGQSATAAYETYF